MPLDQQERTAIFHELARQLSKLANKAAADDVHHFRTYGRRVETLINDLVMEPSRGDKKLLKLLRRLHKKAGKVRDLDVQMSLLQNLKLPQDPRRKAQLLNAMAEERDDREKKLIKAFDRETVRELRKRLKHTAGEIEFSTGIEPLQLAKRKFAELSRSYAPLTEKRLHQFRIAGKRARYIAELADENPETRQFVNELRRLQDALGDWHDWLQLSNRAKELFKDEESSILLSALRNLSRAKFRHATDTLTATLANLNTTPPAPSAPVRKPPASAERSTIAA